MFIALHEKMINVLNLSHQLVKDKFYRQIANIHKYYR